MPNNRKVKKSFHKWCIDNDRHDVLDKWDYTLNKLNPEEINFSTKEKYWFKCPNGIHTSELKSINTFTSGAANIICKGCNSIGQWLTEQYGNDSVYNYWSNKNTEDPFTVSRGSGKNVWIKCPNCGNEKLISVNTFRKSGLGCNKCSDGIPYSEKFMFSFLNQLNINFITQLSKTTFEWCSQNDNEFRYDFYIADEECIIETHGIQHYEDIHNQWNTDLIEQQNNDILKMKIALENGIKEENYIVIDCRYSNIEWIKKSIFNSRLSEMFDLSRINWKKCHEYACVSLVKGVSSLWSNETKNYSIIMEHFKICKNTVIKYLKQGNINGWCDYDPEVEKNNNKVKLSKKILCIELNEIFNSINNAKQHLQIDRKSIGIACKDYNKTAGGYHWMYYEDYLKLHNEANINKLEEVI